MGQLEDVYAGQVANKGRIHQNVGGSAPVVYERDEKLAKLENDIFSKMHNVLKKAEPLPAIKPVAQQVKHVSLEDAIRELAEIHAIHASEQKMQQQP